MNICLAQTIPIKGNIEKNIEAHLKMVRQAVVQKADLIAFPELSLTGFEPQLASKLAISKNDQRLFEFRRISNQHAITICIGAPTRNNNGTQISMFIFQPNVPVKEYAKQYLHSDEFDVFTPGKKSGFIMHETDKIALAICYETSVTEHAENAYNNNSTIYLASVLNSTKSIDKDIKRFSKIANKYHMSTFMVNYAGTSGGYHCAGLSSVWNNKGELVGQLDNINEGLLVFNTVTNSLTRIMY